METGYTNNDTTPIGDFKLKMALPENVNYYQIVEQTNEEKKAMYMKEKKEKLVEMLIECNRIIDEMPITPYESNDYLFGITG